MPILRSTHLRRDVDSHVASIEEKEGQYQQAVDSAIHEAIDGILDRSRSAGRELQHGPGDPLVRQTLSKKLNMPQQLSHRVIITTPMRDDE